MGCQLCAVARFIEGQRTFSVLSPQWASLLTDHSNSGMREKGKRLRPIIRLVSVEKKRLEVLAGPPLLGLTWEHLAWASCCLGGCSQHAPSTNSSLCLCVSVSLSFSLSLSFSYSLSLSLSFSLCHSYLSASLSITEPLTSTKVERLERDACLSQRCSEQQCCCEGAGWTSGRGAWWITCKKHTGQCLYSDVITSLRTSLLHHLYITIHSFSMNVFIYSFLDRWHTKMVCVSHPHKTMLPIPSRKTMYPSL